VVQLLHRPETRYTDVCEVFLCLLSGAECPLKVCECLSVYCVLNWEITHTDKLHDLNNNSGCILHFKGETTSAMIIIIIIIIIIEHKWLSVAYIVTVRAFIDSSIFLLFNLIVRTSG